LVFRSNFIREHGTEEPNEIIFITLQLIDGVRGVLGFKPKNLTLHVRKFPYQRISLPTPFNEVINHIPGAGKLLPSLSPHEHYKEAFNLREFEEEVPLLPLPGDTLRRGSWVLTLRTFLSGERLLLCHC